MTSPKFWSQSYNEFLLCLLACLPSIYAIVFHPALPQISDHFRITMHDVQFLSMCYLFGEAFGQLPYGPLSNRFGRRNTLYFGVILTALGLFLSVVSGFFHSFSFFMVAQILIGVGSCVGPNIAYATVGDLYDERGASKVFALIMFASGLIPCIFNYIGGSILQTMGWKACFSFLFLFCLGTLTLFTFLPEREKEKDLDALKLKRIFQDYFIEIRNPYLMISSLIIGTGICIVYLFASIAPYVVIQGLGVAPKSYALWNFVSTSGFLLGSLTSRFLTQKVSSAIQLLVASKVLIASAIIMQGLFLFKMQVYFLFIPMTVIQFCLALLYTNATTIALTRSTNKAIGSSLLNCINLGIGGVGVWAIRHMELYSEHLLPVLFIGLGSIIFLMVFYLVFLLKRAQKILA